MMALRTAMTGGAVVPEPAPTFTVQITGGSFLYRNWHITLTLGDGTTVVDPANHSTVSGVASLQIDGTAYRDYGDSSAEWYRVVDTSGTLYYDGEGDYSRTSFVLNAADVLDVTKNIVVGTMVHQAECFSENMKVRMADGNDKPIGEVRPGDMIKAWNCVWDSDQEELVDCAVEFSTFGLTRVASKYDKYTFDDGTVVEIITRDRMYCVEDNKMKWADQWHIGEHGLTYDGREVALVSHEVVEEPIVFHDLATPYHNFYVNGLLVGRKLARYPFFPSRLVHNN